jgi:outer membrane protein assembly factor BamD (BamD/ComL family)
MWLRGLLTVDPEMAELDLRRLVVEYPGGPFSDQALIRLAHGARAQSDDVQALEYLNVVLRDYPESPLRNAARSLAIQIENSSPTAEGPIP